ncbi:MAG: SPASM domain-containing protein [Dehalococcoidales bacterium]|nr:SPASM domain-containing protein [Dehalococcoidales bacterium]
MAPETVYKLIDTISEYPEIEKVYLDDVNEPLIDPNTFGYIKALQGKGKKVNLATNGVLLGKQKIRDSLKKTVPDELLISVQTFTKEDFEKTRGTKINFGEYLNNIVDCIGEIYPFLDDGKFIRVEVAIHPGHRLRDRILGLGVSERSFYPDVEDLCTGVAHFLQLLNEHISFPRQEVEEVVLHNIHLARRSKSHVKQIPITSGLFIFLKHFVDWRNYYRGKKNYFVRCHAAELLIRANGDLIRCCNDFKGETKMGNVFETPFQEIIERNFDIISKSLTGRPYWDVCLRCQGQPTYRGALIGNLYSAIKNLRSKRR